MYATGEPDHVSGDTQAGLEFHQLAEMMLDPPHFPCYVAGMGKKA